LIKKGVAYKDKLVILTQRGLNILEFNLSISLSFSVSLCKLDPLMYVNIFFVLIKKGVAYKEELVTLTQKGFKGWSPDYNQSLTSMVGVFNDSKS